MGVGVSGAGLERWGGEPSGAAPGPVRRDGLRPGGYEEVDGDGVFEEVDDFFIGGWGARGREGGFGAGAEVGDVDCGGGEAGGGILGEIFEDGGEFVGAAFEGLAYFDGVLD